MFWHSSSTVGNLTSLVILYVLNLTLVSSLNNGVGLTPPMVRSTWGPTAHLDLLITLLSSLDSTDQTRLLLTMLTFCRAGCPGRNSVAMSIAPMTQQIASPSIYSWKQQIAWSKMASKMLDTNMSL